MNLRSEAVDSLYTQEVLEFAAVGVRLAGLLEQSSDPSTFIQQALQQLPQLYLSTLRLPDYLYDAELDYLEEYITEGAYEAVRQRVSELLGEGDAYLSTQSEQMQYSDTPIAAFVSEALADVYQQVGNLLGILRDENEEALPAAIGRCRHYFTEYWGRELLEALTALHQLHTQRQESEDSLSLDDEDDASSEEEAY